MIGDESDLFTRWYPVATDPLADIITNVPQFDNPLCAQTDAEIFFPDKGASPKSAQWICGQCDHQADCLTWAVENAEQYGIWGGVTAHNRRRMRQADRGNGDTSDRGRPAGIVERRPRRDDRRTA